ncbi:MULTISPECIES: hypothetical protein [Streptomyces]|uniref:Uncharacterized protein n=2 Tax=Streptomyces TaxID=1883 RepID=A0A101PN40_STRCK|nr:hypothetical protein [Streptomyces corchorusii]KUN14572.1 hypothetical protein AQJ11_44435 [Streptomyces corchorusii]
MKVYRIIVIHNGEEPRPDEVQAIAGYVRNNMGHDTAGAGLTLYRGDSVPNNDLMMAILVRLDSEGKLPGGDISKAVLQELNTTKGKIALGIVPRA